MGEKAKDDEWYVLWGLRTVIHSVVYLIKNSYHFSYCSRNTDEMCV